MFWPPVGTVEECLRLDLRVATRQRRRPAWAGGLTVPAQVDFGLHVAVVDFIHRGRRVHQRIPLQATPAHFGGRRWWGTCPGCMRRVAVLLLPVLGRDFRCRGCHHLVYEMAVAGRAQRRALTALRIRRQLGAPEQLGAPWWPSRPPRMRRSTFDALTRTLVDAECQYDDALCGESSRT